jgi:hypothetical protein
VVLYEEMEEILDLRSRLAGGGFKPRVSRMLRGAGVGRAS